jgi:hypothetical protein
MSVSGFWRQMSQNNNRLTLGGFGVLNNVWYVAPQGYAPTLGTPTTRTFTTLADCFNHVKSRDIIYIVGVLREQAVAPLGVFDVTIMGAANQPRQATSGGVPTGGGATWLAPTSPVAATPLLELREQGWTVENIFFNGPTDDACVKLHREETATYPDASHFTARGCRFGGGFIGIEDFGGASNVLVEDCSFEDMAGVGGAAIRVTNQGIAIPSRWMVRNNRFLPCVNGIIGAWVDSQFRFNNFAAMTTATINLASGNTGLRNMLFLNQFSVDNAGFDPAGGYTGNATDIWYSVLSDAVDFGVPA